MKKYIIFSMIIGLFLTACDPNDDLYEAIQNDAKPYSEQFDIELTDADYTTIKKLALEVATTHEDSTIANDLDIYKSFSTRRSAADLIPAFLANSFIALDSASSINVKYKFSVNDYDSLHIQDINYIEIFGTNDTCFSSSFKPTDYLLTVDTTSNYVSYFSCKYGNNFADAVDTTFVYTFVDGTWITPDNFYIVTNSDYESFGLVSSPTEYQFNVTKPAEHYLPNYFENKYPFAYENDDVIVFYNYNSDIKMDGYMFNGTEWVNNTNKVSSFAHNGTEWLFSPIIKYTMIGEDYQIIVDYVTNNPDIPDGYLDEYHPTTTEYYYGANSYYKNFYLKLYNRRKYDPLGLLDGLSDEQALESIWDRIKEGIVIFAETKFTDAQPIENGAQVYYLINFGTYNGTNQSFYMMFKCTDVGKFEYSSGPVELK